MIDAINMHIPNGKVARNDEYATLDIIIPEHIDITNIAGFIACNMDDISNFSKYLAADESMCKPSGITGMCSVKDSIKVEIADNTIKNISGESSLTKRV